MADVLQKVALARDHFPDNQLIAVDTNGPICWHHLQSRIYHWQNRLVEFPHSTVALYHSNAFEFMAILFALWRLSKKPVIPSNKLALTLTQIEKLTDLFVGEFGVEKLSDKKLDDKEFGGAERHAGDGITLLPSSQQQSQYPQFPEDTALILFTSGSTGEPEPVIKQFQQLAAELDLLERQFGGTLAKATVVGTVSHHHMYGLPFRLLWPIVSGRPFFTGEILYLEQLYAQILRQKLILITSPANLENIPGSVNFRSDGPPVLAVFSAGAPLSEQAANNSIERISDRLIEIYGCTETGAVASRCQLIDPVWTTLPGIKVNVTADTGQLEIKSPAIVAGQWFTSADRCTILSETRFILKGRIDKLVKVGGKRVSLTAIESRLSAHPFVERAELVTLGLKKSRLGAVIILNKAGNAELIAKGKRWLNRTLLDELRSVIEPVGYPRFWRYVDQYPVNSQGKTTAAMLEALFYPDTHPKALEPQLPDPQLPEPKLPEIVSKEVIEEHRSVRLTIYIPSNLLYFSGHFPEQPILPGVVQTSWAIHYGQMYFGPLGEFQRLENLKFQHVIKPGRRISMTLTFDKNKSKLYFSYFSNAAKSVSGKPDSTKSGSTKSGSTTHSSGRILFQHST